MHAQSIEYGEPSMMSGKLSDPVRGKTVRLSWITGPTKGAVHEHVFHDDGTVEWHTVSDNGELSHKTTEATNDTSAPAERPAYAAFSITYDVCLISYLSSSGYTLTVVLNFNDGTTRGFASNDKTWVPVKGTFEVMHRRAPAGSVAATAGTGSVFS